MAPIRIGIIGLSQGGWAARAHLPYLQRPESKFKIVAVCNSSLESSRRAVEQFKLGEETRTYGDVQDLANDKDIDLVVCTVRVDRHYDTITPSIRAGKNVFVEWPLGRNLQEAEELLKLSKEYKTKLTAVGLQGRFDSIVPTLKKLLAEGRIGKVLSSTLTCQGNIGGPTATEAYRYLIDHDIGGTLLTIPASHCLDTVEQVLGGIAHFQSLLSRQRRTVKLLGSDGTVTNHNFKMTAHDHIMIHGTLKSGAVIDVSIRGGPPFKDTPGLEWRIYGETGEIRIQSPGTNLQVYSVSSIEMHDFETDKVHKIEMEKGTFDEMPPVSRNVARIYEAIAAGDRTVLCDFEGAVRRHQFIEELYKQNPGS